MSTQIVKWQIVLKYQVSTEKTHTQEQLWVPSIFSPHTTKSNLVLLAEWQGSKSRDKLLEQGIVTLFGKPVDEEDGVLVSPKNILPKLEFKLPLY